jgi:N-methylhydantoinase A
MGDWRLAVDIGGTFTDSVVLDSETGRVVTEKTLTTPQDPLLGLQRGVVSVLAKAGIKPADVQRAMVHATTLVTNALIEGKGARAGLVTTAGFADTLLIRNEHRYDMYDLQIEFPPPPVPRELIVEVGERTDAEGTVLASPDMAEVDRVAEELRKAGVEAVAVCFLHAYANPANERAVAARLAERLSVPVCASSEIAPQIREYPRTVTTVCNAITMPVVGRYLQELQEWLGAHGFGGGLLVMLSNGGVVSPEVARRAPIRLVESGPAAGALAGAWYAKRLGLDRLLCFDMGGTTAKACLIEDGEPSLSVDFEVARMYRFKKGSGYPVTVPSVDLVEIGAGGGSLARVDTLGLLKVGPESAGAEPGPACYGRGGTTPAVTDADLLLGYLDPDFFLGGRMTLDRAAAEDAIRTKIAEPLEMSPTRAAWGIHQLVNEGMAGAARVHAIERGKDPRALPLFAFGGAGPGHGFGVARILHSPRLIVPFGAGVTSTVGFLTAPLAFDFVRSFVHQLDTVDWDHINALLADMAAQGDAILARSGVAADERRVTRQADLRYAGQGHEIRIDLPDGTLGPDSLPAIAANFEQVYRSLFGRTGPDVPLEGVSWRLLSSGPRPDVKLRASAGVTESDALKGQRLVYFPEWQEHRPVPVYDRYRLVAGRVFDGPAIVEERESTSIIGPGARIEVDDTRNLSVWL